MTLAVSSHLIHAALEGVIRALTEREHLNTAQRAHRAQGVMEMVMGFEPQDVVQLMLGGQAALFNELTADAAHDALRGSFGVAKDKARSAAANLGKVLVKSIDTLIRLQGGPVHAAAAPVVEEEIPEAAPTESESPVEPAAPVPADEPAANAQTKAASETTTGETTTGVAALTRADATGSHGMASRPMRGHSVPEPIHGAA